MDEQGAVRHVGSLMGIPYDWRPPTLARVRERWLNPHDRRLLTPKSFGWGYDINLFELGRRLVLYEIGRRLLRLLLRTSRQF